MLSLFNAVLTHFIQIIYMLALKKITETYKSCCIFWSTKMEDAGQKCVLSFEIVTSKDKDA